MLSPLGDFVCWSCFQKDKAEAMFIGMVSALGVKRMREIIGEAEKDGNL